MKGEQITNDYKARNLWTPEVRIILTTGALVATTAIGLYYSDVSTLLSNPIVRAGAITGMFYAREYLVNKIMMKEAESKEKK